MANWFGELKFCIGTDAGVGELLGPNNAMMESLLILPSVTELLVAVASLETDSEAVLAGDTDDAIDDDDTAGADTNPLNSELRPSRS